MFMALEKAFPDEINDVSTYWNKWNNAMVKNTGFRPSYQDHRNIWYWTFFNINIQIFLKNINDKKSVIEAVLLMEEIILTGKREHQNVGYVKTTEYETNLLHGNIQLFICQKYSEEYEQVES